MNFECRAKQAMNYNGMGVENDPIDFLLVIVSGLVETVAQYYWMSLYFQTGIPLIRVCVSSEDDQQRIDATLENKFVAKNPGAKQFAIRQVRFGAARYAFVHAIGVIDEQYRSCTVTVFLDFNVLFLGAFFGVLAAGETIASCFLGVAIAWMLCRNFVDRKSIEYIAQSMLCSKPV